MHSTLANFFDRDDLKGCYFGRLVSFVDYFDFLDRVSADHAVHFGIFGDVVLMIYLIKSQTLVD